ncbi:class I adenylate-forming enzyme family protein [Brevibacterium otitidis]|uniref:Class I adenylate-forming enzyme family protein n=1 Tax=Brevibacterium otitidis TaxID=53364 RepID=A0ABV5X4U6_9MICO
MTTEGAQTIGTWLQQRAVADPRAIAIDDRGVLIDYASLCARAEALAEHLGTAGYGAGSRICTVSGNSIDHVAAFFACALAGAVFMPLSWRLTPAELSELLRRSEPDLVLIEDEHMSLGEEALRQWNQRDAHAAVPPHIDIAAAGIDLGLPAAHRSRPMRAARGEDPLLVIYTSGSEAAPKGVVLSHANCCANNEALAQAMPMTRDDVVLSMLPQHHVAAWNVQPLLAWREGATVVLERSFQPERVLQLIEQRQVTTMMGVPTQYQMLLDVPGSEARDFSSLRRAVVGGATIPIELAQAWAQRGVQLTQGYGLTEAGPNVLFLPPDELADNPGAVGRPYPSVDVQLVDPSTGNVLDGAATGELWVGGPSIFTGYLDDEAATAAAMSDGWLRTGDLVERDDAGIHRVVDRIKNIYVSGGENVAPAEVELVLLAHDHVDEAVVVSAPDPVWGERGVAFVVTREPVRAEDLLAFARTRLAGFKIPVHVEFVDELPKSTIEKIARHRLRRRAQKAVESLRQKGQTHA